MSSSSHSTRFQRVPQDVSDYQNDDDPVQSLSNNSNDGIDNPGHKEDYELPEGSWGVDWLSPALMAASFITAVGCAIGHHFYYASLDREVVVDVASKWSLHALQDSQEWKIRLGTGFAFLVKTLFATAVTIAFHQRIWVNSRNKAMSVKGLDAMFSAATSIFSLLNGEFWGKATIGAILASVVWLIPLSALVTPATLTVVPSTISNATAMPVPSINFSNTSPLYDYTSSVIGSDNAASDNGITPLMARLVSSSATTLQILPMAKTIANSSYQMEFHGPSLRCRPPSDSIHEAILAILNATWYVSTTTSMSNEYDSDMAWLAFAPTARIMNAVADSKKTPISQHWLNFLKFTVACIVQPAMFDSTIPGLNDDIPLCEGITTPQPSLRTSLKNVSSVFAGDQSAYNYGRIWVWAQNTSYDCILTDTKYHVRFEYSSSENAQRIDPAYSFEWTDDDLYGSYFPVATALANLLGGAIRGFFTGMMSYNTRVSETAIFGAFRADPNSDSATNAGLTLNVLPSDITDLARNKSVGELIEELSRNVTLSLFSANKVLSLNSTNAMVNTTANVNIYSYNRKTLIFTYASTFGLSLIGIIIGLVAYVQNGVSYSNSFSTFLLTTRNHRLDKLATGSSMGSEPLRKDIKNTRLRFGALVDESGRGLGSQAPRRVGFGFTDQVLALKKREPYY